MIASAGGASAAPIVPECAISSALLFAVEVDGPAGTVVGVTVWISGREALEEAIPQALKIHRGCFAIELRLNGVTMHAVEEAKLCAVDRPWLNFRRVEVIDSIRQVLKRLGEGVETISGLCQHVGGRDGRAR